MIRTGEIVLEHVAFSLGGKKVDNTLAVPGNVVRSTGFATRYEAAEGEGVFELSMDAARKLPSGALDGIGGVVAATFSARDRFPALSVRIASALGIPADAPALDLQMACSAYPYALYVAGAMSASTGKRVLVVDGDVQTPLAAEGGGTRELFSDASSVSVVRADGGGESAFAFLSRYSRDLACPSAGPVSMDGFGVFSFVATEVAPFLEKFAREAGSFDWFVPHQANMFMVKRLADDLGFRDRMLSSGGSFANPGSASIPVTIAHCGKSGRFLLAGFGAGLSAAAATVRVADDGCPGRTSVL